MNIVAGNDKKLCAFCLNMQSILWQFDIKQLKVSLEIVFIILTIQKIPSIVSAEVRIDNCI